jgi:4-hydroxy-3-methylbut-2-enyl diphosphate reductase
VDDAERIIRVLRRRFPHIVGPSKDDICYATQNRQDAVKVLARQADVVLVIGSVNSSNSNRLAEVAREAGTPAYLVDDETEVKPEWLASADVVGVTSGASAPEWLVDRMIAFLQGQGATEVEELRLTDEDVRFSKPAGLRRLEVLPR